MFMTAAMALFMISPAISNVVSAEEEPLTQGQDWEWITYCNGTPAWVSWGGTYRGTWFDLEDFWPGAQGGFVSQANVWFYHSPSNPWDTSQISLELWTGGSQGPSSMVTSETMTAAHMIPCPMIFDPPISVPNQFWCVFSTEMSAGGWPSMLVDNASEPIPHSFFSDDLVIWEPWSAGGGYANYFIYLLMEVDSALERMSWAGLKTVF